MTLVAGKRTLAHIGDGFVQQPPFKRLAVGAESSSDLFGGLGRDAYMQQRVHRKLHPQAATMSDQDLFQLGRQSFNEQFPAVEALNLQGHSEQRQETAMFGGLGRDAYMQQRVHRKLHAQAAALSDQELSDVGKRSFNEQFAMVEQAAAQRQQHQQVDSFGGVGRDAYMQQHVHRKLHAQAAALSDQELMDLGKLSFNEQFPIFGEPALEKQQQDVDMFGGVSRDAYMNQHVHRKLHASAATLSDFDLLELGRRSFNEQFPMLGQEQSAAREHPQTQQWQADMFGGLGRDGYMQQRVHRKLHTQAAVLSDEELLELGKLSFNDQFPTVERLKEIAGGQQQHATARQAYGSQQQQDMFGGLGRDAYMQQRVHRKLHAMAAALSDAELLEIGKLSFNEQFPVLQQMHANEQSMLQQSPGSEPVSHQQQHVDMFGGLGRDAYMQQRVHRKLHNLAAALSNQDLLELGKLSFNEQFPYFENGGARGQASGEQAQQQRQPQVDMFGGLGRDAYMQQHVHRRLHPQAATLSDHDLLDLGRRSFNEQFPMFEQSAAGEQPRPVDVFGGLGRDGYMQQRVHRKLHAQAASLSDEELLELGKLSFNDQFPTVEKLKEIGVDQQQQGDLFGPVGRNGYMHSRIHRRLHAQAAQLSDQDLFELGKLSFNAQFPIIEGTSSLGDVAPS